MLGAAAALGLRNGRACAAALRCAGRYAAAPCTQQQRQQVTVAAAAAAAAHKLLPLSRGFASSAVGDAAAPSTTTVGGIAFKDDTRGVSGLGMGDGLSSHTAKWMTPGTGKSPMELVGEAPPIYVSGRVAECHGGDDPALGHPVEYINIDAATEENPAVCKYCGCRYIQAHHH